MKKLLSVFICLQIFNISIAQKTISTSFDHVALSVKNMDTSVNFYTDILGLKEIKNRGEKDGIRWFSLGDGKELHLISTVKGKIKQNKAVHFAVSMSSFEAFISKLRQHNIEYSPWQGKQNTITTRADGVKQVYVQDPDNYWIEINSVSNKSKTNAVTTLYFIRHAEKDRTDPYNRNPHLTEVGKKRAQKWKQTFKNVTFDAVYSTNYHRTKETALPTALQNNLQLTMYNPRQIDYQLFLSKNKGKTILVVGHSNTTPAFVNTLLGIDKYAQIEDANNGNLYTLTINEDTYLSTLLSIE